MKGMIRILCATACLEKSQVTCLRDQIMMGMLSTEYTYVEMRGRLSKSSMTDRLRFSLERDIMILALQAPDMRIKLSANRTPSWDYETM